MMRHAPRVALSRRHAARVHAAATAEAAAPADLTSTTISLPRLQFAPRGRMTREVDGVTLTGTGVLPASLPRAPQNDTLCYIHCCSPVQSATRPKPKWCPSWTRPAASASPSLSVRRAKLPLPPPQRRVQPPKAACGWLHLGVSHAPTLPKNTTTCALPGADQVVRYDPGHPSPMKPVGGLDGLGALQLGTLSEAAEVINYRAAMVGLLGVVLDDRSLGQQVFSGSLFSAVFVVAFVTAASLAPFVAGVVDADELFPNEMNPYENERLPEFWTPAAEKLNGRVAAVAFALIALHELF